MEHESDISCVTLYFKWVPIRFFIPFRKNAKQLLRFLSIYRWDYILHSRDYGLYKHTDRATVSNDGHPAKILRALCAVNLVLLPAELFRSTVRYEGQYAGYACQPLLQVRRNLRWAQHLPFSARLPEGFPMQHGHAVPQNDIGLSESFWAR